MSVEDLKSLLALISSDRLTLKGSEVQLVARLQVELHRMILPRPEPEKEDEH